MATTAISRGYNINTHITPIKYHTTPFTLSRSLSRIRNPKYSSQYSLNVGNVNRKKSAVAHPTRPAERMVTSGPTLLGFRCHSHSVRNPIELCSVLRGISQSTTVFGVAPGEGLRVILLVRRLRVVGGMGRPSVPRAEEGAGGGGLAKVLEREVARGEEGREACSLVGDSRNAESGSYARLPRMSSSVSSCIGSSVGRVSYSYRPGERGADGAGEGDLVDRVEADGPARCRMAEPPSAGVCAGRVLADI